MNFAVLAAIAAHILAFILIFEGQTTLFEEKFGWRFGITLSHMAHLWPWFGVALVAFIWFACGMFTFHIIERTGITK